MAKLKLKKKNYLGEGYTHQFTNNTTGEVIFVPTTKAQYESMGIKGGSKNNPTLDGHTWQSSSGGTIAVDNADSVLKEGEYCEIGEEVVCRVANSDVSKQWKRSPKANMAKDPDEIDELKLRNF